MRIIAGSARGRLLKVPPGRKVRPSADRMKEALFSILAERVDGAVVLDLFAGSGALGLEALSRGAAKCYFVEIDRSTCRFIRENVNRISMQERAVIRTGPAHRVLLRLGGEGLKTDLVFIDPPYDRFALAVEALADLAQNEILNEGAVVILENSIKTSLDTLAAGYCVSVEKKYGDSRITFLEQQYR